MECPVGFTTRGARSAYSKYVEHPEARKHRWVRCIAGRSRKLVRYAGLTGSGAAHDDQRPVVVVGNTIDKGVDDLFD